MKWIVTLSLLITTVSLFAQNSTLTIFNNNGQQFFVIMNGIKQNAIPHTNVKVEGMTTGAYEIKLIFNDGKTGDINKKFFIDQPGNYQARVVINGKKRKLQFFGMGEATPAPAGGTPVQYRPNDQSVYSDQSGTTTGTATSGNGQATGAVTGSTGTSTNSGGMNVNVNVQDPAMNGGTGGVTVTTNGTGVGSNSTSVSSSSTSTSSTTTVNGQVTESSHHSSTSVTENGQTTTTSTSSQNGGAVSTERPQSTAVDLSKIEAANKPPKGSPASCKMMLTNTETFVESIKNENFDQDKKARIIKETADKCVTADQAYKIVSVLGFDVDKLEISKYLYDRMTDKPNAERLTELMNFDVDKQNFREYMRTH